MAIGELIILLIKFCGDPESPLWSCPSMAAYFSYDWSSKQQLPVRSWVCPHHVISHGGKAPQVHWQNFPALAGRADGTGSHRLALRQDWAQQSASIPQHPRKNSQSTSFRKKPRNGYLDPVCSSSQVYGISKITLILCCVFLLNDVVCAV